MSNADTGPERPAARPEHLTALAAVDLARLVSTRQLRAQEVVEAHLTCVQSLNGALNALVRVDADEALRAAGRLDDAVRHGRPVGPLAGVPFVVKDNIDVHGQETASGSRAHQWRGRDGRRARRTPPARGGRDPARARQHGRARDGRLDADLVPRAHPQPGRPATQPRRQLGWERGSRRGRLRPARRGHRHRRFDPRARLAVRSARDGSLRRPRVAGRRDPVRPGPGSRRSARALRG